MLSAVPLAYLAGIRIDPRKEPPMTLHMSIHAEDNANLTNIHRVPYALLRKIVLLSRKEDSKMNRTLTIVALLSLASPLAGTAQTTMQTASLTPATSPREMHDLMKSAHSVAQYKELAGYFHQREADYRAKAAAEIIERDRRAEVNAGLYQKYPRPVDSAQTLYESYVADANSAALQARHYDQLASEQSQRDQQEAASPQGKP
jgi:hypothetical protein